MPAERTRIARSRSVIQRMPDEEIDAARAADRITTAHFRAGGRVIATMCTGMAQWFHERGMTRSRESPRNTENSPSACWERIGWDRMCGPEGSTPIASLAGGKAGGSAVRILPSRIGRHGCPAKI